MIFIELLIFLSTILPIFHIINSLSFRKTQVIRLKREEMMSILVPCYNERDTVKISIQGLLNMHYSNYEALYINDGSCDDTFEELCNILDLELIDTTQEFDSEAYKFSLFFKRTMNLGIKGVYRSKRYRNFFVIDKQNGGKSSALNAGILFAHSKLIVTLDADSVLEKSALIKMNGVFSDKNVVAAGGSIHIMQGYDNDYIFGRYDKKRSLFVTMQILEYLKGFYIYKKSLAKQNATAIISGAFGVFTRDILLKAGGFRKTIGEDIDITLCIQRIIHGTSQKILYFAEALCYTQCPESLQDLIKQRIRWQKGFINCLLHYKKFLIKTVFTKSLSFHFLFEAAIIGICSCIFTVFTYLFVAVFSFSDLRVLTVFGIYFGFGVVFNIIYSICSVFVSVKKHRYPRAVYKKMMLAILLDIFYYRYFNLFMYLGGTISYFWKHKDLSWNKVARNKREFNVQNI